MSAKSARIAISRLKRTGFWLLLVMSMSSCSPPFDMTADHQAQRARRDRPVLGHEGAVGQEDARRVRSNGAAVEQIPRLAVGIDRPGADHPGIAEIQPACCLASSPARRSR